MRTLSNYFTNLFFVGEGARFALKRKHIEKDVKIIGHIISVKYKDSIKVTCQIIPFYLNNIGIDSKNRTAENF